MEPLNQMPKNPAAALELSTKLEGVLTAVGPGKLVVTEQYIEATKRLDNALRPWLQTESGAEETTGHKSLSQRERVSAFERLVTNLGEAASKYSTTKQNEALLMSLKCTDSLKEISAALNDQLAAFGTFVQHDRDNARLAFERGDSHIIFDLKSGEAFVGEKSNYGAVSLENLCKPLGPGEVLLPTGRLQGVFTGSGSFLPVGATTFTVPDPLQNLGSDNGQLCLDGVPNLGNLSPHGEIICRFVMGNKGQPITDGQIDLTLRNVFGTEFSVTYHGPISYEPKAGILPCGKGVMSKEGEADYIIVEADHNGLWSIKNEEG